MKTVIVLSKSLSKVSKIAVYRFLISFLVLELLRDWSLLINARDRGGRDLNGA